MERTFERNNSWLRTLQRKWHKMTSLASIVHPDQRAWTTMVEMLLMFLLKMFSSGVFVCCCGFRIWKDFCFEFVNNSISFICIVDIMDSHRKFLVWIFSGLCEIWTSFSSSKLCLSLFHSTATSKKEGRTLYPDSLIIRFIISCEDIFSPTTTCVLALMTSLGNKTSAEQHPVMAPIKNGFPRLGGPTLLLLLLGSAGSSGKARFKASFTPKAMAFSSAIPQAVGTAPFQNAAIPCQCDMNRYVNTYT